MKVNLVLSGGAARGIAHIGVIKALQDLGVQIVGISGVSAGALVGTFYSAGYSPEDMLHIVKKGQWLRYIRPKLPRLGLFSLSTAVKFLEDTIPYKRVEELPIKTYMCALDIKSGEVLYFERGDIPLILLGSCALPGIFEPVRYEKYLLVDGGVANNLPIEPFVQREGLLVGVDVNPKEAVERVSNIAQLLIRSFVLAVRSNVDKRKELCDIVIEPPLQRYSLLNVGKAQELYQIGYKTTVEVMKPYVQ